MKKLGHQSSTSSTAPLVPQSQLNYAAWGNAAEADQLEADSGMGLGPLLDLFEETEGGFGFDDVQPDAGSGGGSIDIPNDPSIQVFVDPPPEGQVRCGGQAVLNPGRGLASDLDAPPIQLLSVHDQLKGSGEWKDPAGQIRRLVSPVSPGLELALEDVELVDGLGDRVADLLLRALDGAVRQGDRKAARCLGYLARLRFMTAEMVRDIAALCPAILGPDVTRALRTVVACASTAEVRAAAERVLRSRPMLTTQEQPGVSGAPASASNDKPPMSLAGVLRDLLPEAQGTVAEAYAADISRHYSEELVRRAVINARGWNGASPRIRREVAGYEAPIEPGRVMGQLRFGLLHTGDLRFLFFELGTAVEAIAASDRRALGDIKDELEGLREQREFLLARLGVDSGHDIDVLDYLQDAALDFFSWLSLGLVDVDSDIEDFEARQRLRLDQIVEIEQAVAKFAANQLPGAMSRVRESELAAIHWNYATARDQGDLEGADAIGREALGSFGAGLEELDPTLWESLEGCEGDAVQRGVFPEPGEQEAPTFESTVEREELGWYRSYGDSDEEPLSPEELSGARWEDKIDAIARAGSSAMATMAWQHLDFDPIFHEVARGAWALSSAAPVARDLLDRLPAPECSMPIPGMPENPGRVERKAEEEIQLQAAIEGGLGPVLRVLTNERFRGALAHVDRTAAALRQGAACAVPLTKEALLARAGAHEALGQLDLDPLSARLQSALDPGARDALLGWASAGVAELERLDTLAFRVFSESEEASVQLGIDRVAVVCKPNPDDAHDTSCSPRGRLAADWTAEFFDYPSLALVADVAGVVAQVVPELRASLLAAGQDEEAKNAVRASASALHARMTEGRLAAAMQIAPRRLELFAKRFADEEMPSTAARFLVAAEEFCECIDPAAVAADLSPLMKWEEGCSTRVPGAADQALIYAAPMVQASPRRSAEFRAAVDALANSVGDPLADHAAMVVLDQDPALLAFAQHMGAACQSMGALGSMVGMAANGGHKTPEFISQALSRVEALQESLKTAASFREVAEQRMHQLYLPRNEPVHQRYQALHDMLGAFEQLRESEGDLAAFVADKSNFHADNFLEWLENDGVRIAGAVLCAVVAVALTVASCGAFAVTAPLWLVAFAGAVGGYVGMEATRDLQFTLRQAYDPEVGSGERTYNDRSDLTNYMASEGIHDPATGQMVERDLWKHVVDPAVRRISMDFVVSFATMGLGKLASGWINRLLKRGGGNAVLQRLGPSVGRIGDRLGKVASAGGGKAFVWKFLKQTGREFADELGDEAMEGVLGAALNRVWEDLGVLSSLIIATGKGVDLGGYAGSRTITARLTADSRATLIDVLQSDGHTVNTRGSVLEVTTYDGGRVVIVPESGQPRDQTDPRQQTMELVGLAKNTDDLKAARLHAIEHRVADAFTQAVWAHEAKVSEIFGSARGYQASLGLDLPPGLDDSTLDSVGGARGEVRPTDLHVLHEAWTALKSLTAEGGQYAEQTRSRVGAIETMRDRIVLEIEESARFEQQLVGDKMVVRIGRRSAEYADPIMLAGRLVHEYTHVLQSDDADTLERSWNELEGDAYRAEFAALRALTGDDFLAFADRVERRFRRASFGRLMRAFGASYTQEIRAKVPVEEAKKRAYERAWQVFEGQILPELKVANGKSYEEHYEDDSASCPGERAFESLSPDELAVVDLLPSEARKQAVHAAAANPELLREMIDKFGADVVGYVLTYHRFVDLPTLRLRVRRKKERNLVRDPGLWGGLDTTQDSFDIDGIHFEVIKDSRIPDEGEWRSREIILEITTAEGLKGTMFRAFDREKADGRNPRPARLVFESADLEQFVEANRKFVDIPGLTVTDRGVPLQMLASLWAFKRAGVEPAEIGQARMMLVSNRDTCLQLDWLAKQFPGVPMGELIAHTHSYLYAESTLAQMGLQIVGVDVTGDGYRGLMPGEPDVYEGFQIELVVEPGCASAPAAPAQVSGGESASPALPAVSSELGEDSEALRVQVADAAAAVAGMQADDASAIQTLEAAISADRIPGIPASWRVVETFHPTAPGTGVITVVEVLQHVQTLELLAQTPTGCEAIRALVDNPEHGVRYLRNRGSYMDQAAGHSNIEPEAAGGLDPAVARGSRLVHEMAHLDTSEGEVESKIGGDREAYVQSALWNEAESCGAEVHFLLELLGDEAQGAIGSVPHARAYTEMYSAALEAGFSDSEASAIATRELACRFEHLTPSSSLEDGEPLAGAPKDYAGLYRSRWHNHDSSRGEVDSSELFDGGEAPDLFATLPSQPAPRTPWGAVLEALGRPAAGADQLKLDSALREGPCAHQYLTLIEAGRADAFVKELIQQVGDAMKFGDPAPEMLLGAFLKPLLRRHFEATPQAPAAADVVLVLGHDLYGLGDTIMASSIINGLRGKYSKARIVVTTHTSDGRAAAVQHSLQKKVYGAIENLDVLTHAEVASNLQGQADVIVDLGTIGRAAPRSLIASSSADGAYVVTARSPSQVDGDEDIDRTATGRSLFRTEGVHRALGLEDPALKLEANPDVRSKGTALLQAHGLMDGEGTVQPFSVVWVGSSDDGERRMGRDYWARQFAGMTKPILVLTGPNVDGKDGETGNPEYDQTIGAWQPAFEESLGDAIKCISAEQADFSSLPVGAVLEIFSMAREIHTNDTGIAHVAEAALAESEAIERVVVHTQGSDREVPWGEALLAKGYYAAGQREGSRMEIRSDGLRVGAPEKAERQVRPGDFAQAGPTVPDAAEGVVPGAIQYHSRLTKPNDAIAFARLADKAVSSADARTFCLAVMRSAGNLWILRTLYHAMWKPDDGQAWADAFRRIEDGFWLQDEPGSGVHVPYRNGERLDDHPEDTNNVGWIDIETASERRQRHQAQGPMDGWSSWQRELRAAADDYVVGAVPHGLNGKGNVIELSLLGALPDGVTAQRAFEEIGLVLQMDGLVSAHVGVVDAWYGETRQRIEA